MTSRLPLTTPSRTQLDALGERLRNGSATADDWRILTDYRMHVRASAAPLLDAVRELAAAESLAFSTRLKTDYSIVEKLRRTTIRLRQIDDIIGCRVIVPDVAAQDVLAGRITLLGPAKVRDRRVRPSSGYRAVHVIVGSEPYIEVQVRTRLQDAWAEYSELAADAFGADVKYGGGPARVRKMLDALSQQFALRESGISFMPGGAITGVREVLDEIRELL